MTHVEACVSYRSSYGCLPLDCWYLIGKRCSVTARCKIAATCTKLKTLFFRHFDLKHCLLCIENSDPEVGLNRASKNGDRKLVDFFISHGALDYWDTGLYWAAAGGHRDLVDFFILKGAVDWNIALYGAAIGGHRNLIDLFISKGASYWSWGIAGAALCTDDTVRPDLVDFFISKGETLPPLVEDEEDINLNDLVW